jgi:dienelactone hydrolase
MLQVLFHAWERRLAAATTDRVVRPFDWGLEWISANGQVSGDRPEAILRQWVSQVMADTDAFFTPPATNAYALSGASPEGDRVLTFPSALETPHPENNTVYARLFPNRTDRKADSRAALRPFDKLRVAPSDVEGRQTKGAAVLVLPQWNSDPGGHVGLCRLLAMNGMTALRLSLPYHDRRMPPELHRADYIVSANVGRTVQVCRQAVLDARRAIAWLAAEGYDRIGILGSSLGSCLALLTTAHEPLIAAAALNHISPQFADVVWRGLSTAHVRAGLDGNLDLDLLRELWKPISPASYLERMRGRPTLLVYAKYDLTFPVDLSQDLVRQFRERDIPHEVAVLHCGHYSSGRAPFKFIDGWILSRFLRRALITA